MRHRPRIAFALLLSASTSCPPCVAQQMLLAAPPCREHLVVWTEMVPGGCGSVAPTPAAIDCCGPVAACCDGAIVVSEGPAPTWTGATESILCAGPADDECGVIAEPLVVVAEWITDECACASDAMPVATTVVIGDFITPTTEPTPATEATTAADVGATTTAEAVERSVIVPAERGGATVQSGVEAASAETAVPAPADGTAPEGAPNGGEPAPVPVPDRPRPVRRNLFDEPRRGTETSPPERPVGEETPAAAPPNKGAPADAPPAAEPPDTADPGSDPFSAVLRTPGTPQRRWTDDTGRHGTIGRLVEIRGRAVRILKPTGRTTTVPFTRLSAGDRAHVIEMAPGLAARLAPPPRTARAEPVAALHDTAGL